MNDVCKIYFMWPLGDEKIHNKSSETLRQPIESDWKREEWQEADGRHDFCIWPLGKWPAKQVRSDGEPQVADNYDGPLDQTSIFASGSLSASENKRERERESLRLARQFSFVVLGPGGPLSLSLSLSLLFFFFFFPRVLSVLVSNTFSLHVRQKERIHHAAWDHTPGTW